MDADDRLLTCEIKTLTLTVPFRIAHGVSSERQVVRVRHGDAIGEAPFVPYYNEPVETTLAWLREQIWGEKPDADGPRVGMLALDLLKHDWRGKRASKPLWQMLGGGTFVVPPACRSLGIPTDLDAFKERVQEVNRQFKVIKLKLGSGNIDFDEAIAAYAHEAAPKAFIFADANGGWSIQDAGRIIPRLLRKDIEFVEQPIHHDGGIELWKELRSSLPSRSMPLVADESAQTLADVKLLGELVDGVNVKLLKCGGLIQARDMILGAKERGLRVILGCMIESSIGVTAAAHLAPLADWIDLDGHLYVANDDYAGIQFDEDGKLLMPQRAGIGAAVIPVEPIR